MWTLLIPGNMLVYPPTDLQYQNHQITVHLFQTWIVQEIGMQLGYPGLVCTNLLVYLVEVIYIDRLIMGLLGVKWGLVSHGEQ